MEFLDTIESIRAEEASIQKLFGSEGRAAKRQGGSPKYKEMLAEALDFVADVLDGRKPIHYLKEAMTTSDFPILFGDILDRQILANYQEWTITWSDYAERKVVRDFRPVKLRWFDGGDERLERVHEQEEYPETTLREDEASFQVEKYGKRMPFSWESFINDDLDILRDAPERFARASRRTEELMVTELIAEATGPSDPFFSSGNGNLLTGAGSALSIAALQDAFELMGEQTDDDDNPIVFDKVRLVVPPALEVTARNILNATELQVGADGDGKLTTTNWMKNRVSLSVNPYLSIVNTTNGRTAWYLLPEPGGATRPAIVLGFLRGHEDPQVFMKDPNARRVGGGVVAPEEGDFDTDSIEYKVRHVLGSAQIDPRMAIAATGQ